MNFQIGNGGVVCTKEKTRLQIWNSGGGVQSSAIAALIITGAISPPDIAVIADTGRERSSTWDYLERYVMPALLDVGVVLYRVAKADFTKTDLYGGKDGKALLIPAYTNQSGDVGKLPNWCSAHWKRDVVRRWASQVHGAKSVTNWIGYSTDEMGRANKAQTSKKNQGKWQTRFPLIELGMNRGNCQALCRRMGWPDAPRSSCWNCPNMHVDEWRDVKASRDWEKVIWFDRQIRERDPNVYLTSDCKPIDQVDFDDANEVLFGRDSGGCDSGFCFV